MWPLLLLVLLRHLALRTQIVVLGATAVVSWTAALLLDRWVATFHAIAYGPLAHVGALLLGAMLA